MCTLCLSRSIIQLVVDVLSSSAFCFFQAEDGIRDLVRSRGLGDVYKRQLLLRGVERKEIERGQVIAKPGSITPHTKFKAEALSLIHI